MLYVWCILTHGDGDRPVICKLSIKISKTQADKSECFKKIRNFLYLLCSLKRSLFLKISQLYYSDASFNFYKVLLSHRRG